MEIAPLEIVGETGLHFLISGKSGEQIRKITGSNGLLGGAKYFAGTCCRIGCYNVYGYSGNNPHYCPGCLSKERCSWAIAKPLVVRNGAKH